MSERLELPRCSLNDASPSTDWREWCVKLSHDELAEAGRRIAAYMETLQYDRSTDKWYVVLSAINAEKAKRFEPMLAKLTYCECELGKAKTQRRMEVFSP